MACSGVGFDLSPLAGEHSQEWLCHKRRLGNKGDGNDFGDFDQMRASAVPVPGGSGAKILQRKMCECARIVARAVYVRA